MTGGWTLVTDPRNLQAVRISSLQDRMSATTQATTQATNEMRAMQITTPSTCATKKKPSFPNPVELLQQLCNECPEFINYFQDSTEASDLGYDSGDTGIVPKHYGDDFKSVLPWRAMFDCRRALDHGQIQTTENGPTVTFSGRGTYAHRDVFKRLGAKWNPYRKAWAINRDRISDIQLRILTWSLLVPKFLDRTAYDNFKPWRNIRRFG